MGWRVDNIRILFGMCQVTALSRALASLFFSVSQKILGWNLNNATTSYLHIIPYSLFIMHTTIIHRLIFWQHC